MDGWIDGRTDGCHADRYIPRTYRSEDKKIHGPEVIQLFVFNSAKKRRQKKMKYGLTSKLAQNLVVL